VVELDEPEADPLPEADPTLGAPGAAETPPVVTGGRDAPGNGTAIGARCTVASTPPLDARSCRLPRTAHGPGLERATEELIGAARATKPPTGAIVSVAPPSKVTRTWATDGSTTAATHHAGDPSVTPKFPVVIEETRCDPLLVALAEPVLGALGLLVLLPAEPPAAIADPSNKLPCPTAAASDMSIEYQV